MHHAVRVASIAPFTPSHLTMAVQMIDKVWYDWQNKDPRNKYAYGGGSVTPIPSYANYTMFPTGLPPYLNVSASLDLKRTFRCLIRFARPPV